MFILKNEKGLEVHGKISNEDVLPLIVEKTNKVFIVKVGVLENKLGKITVIKEITRHNNNVLFNSIINIANLNDRKKECVKTDISF